jgi:predicted AlkP superfamily phosphohydrolase/phosphomutase
MWHGVDPLSPLSAAPSAALAGRGLRAVYEAIDASVGSIIEAAGDATVVIFSVKGMRVAEFEVVAPYLVPELLYRLQFGRALVPCPNAEGPLPPPLLPARSAREGRTAWLSNRLRRRWRTLTHRAAATTAEPPHVPVDALRVGPDVHEYRDGHPAYRYREAWPRMRAFVIPSFSDVHIRINVAGRERTGLVQASEYDAACSEIEAELGKCIDVRTGQPVFSKFTRMRTGGPFSAEGAGADLIAACAAPTDAMTHPATGQLGPFPHVRVGAHDTEGFAWVAGDGIAPGEVGGAGAVDLPPTILELLGARPPFPLDGTAVRGLLPRSEPRVRAAELARSGA